MPSGARTGATVTHSSGKNAKQWTLCYRRWTGSTCHEYQHRNREILRNYKAVINARRREMGQKPLTTAQIVDEICDFVANQQAVFLGGHYILQGSINR
ncbi:hypothetical protein ECZC18_53980 [Escherichia coli]|nr:hypothetical protein ECZC18_53980 [Escherichia coli]